MSSRRALPVDLPQVFVPPRRLLAHDINRLPSPSGWSHAFPSSGPRSENSPSSLSNASTFHNYDKAGSDLDDNGSYISPQREEFRFRIGKQEHFGFSSAIAALMLRTNQETDLVTETVVCKTPVMEELALRDDFEAVDASPMPADATKGGDSDAVTGPVGDIANRTGGDGAAKGINDDTRVGLSIVPMQFSMSMPNPTTTTSRTSPFKDDVVVRRGRFEVRRLDS
ncbi:hypothetical protein HDU83_002651 [Entophlyctis luteolus]|nr:hypothetical protein HDU83_002651 [Entophlyctis luteolus]KAJ3385752.1 hypothetical protein HDU84_002043 [Entophlyctis sp. JEL0112]